MVMENNEVFLGDQLCQCGVGTCCFGATDKALLITARDSN
jgi:hypothetical protein